MTFRILAALALAGATCCPAGAAEPVNIGSRLELFVDDYLIEKMEGGAELILHRPTPRELAVVHDAPWEGPGSGYHTVFADGDLYRMYYRGGGHACYAYSKDGIHWTKPELGLFEFDGSKKNNIIWIGLGDEEFAPTKDGNPKCPPDEKYKALAHGKGPERYGQGKGGLYAFKSPDGIHWSLMQPDAPVITDKDGFDSLNTAFWDSHRGRYAAFYRSWRDDTGKTKGIRNVKTATSDDFIHWTEGQWLDFGDAPKEQLYTNSVTRYDRAPHIFLGFPMRYIPSRYNPTKGGGEQLSDGLFMASHDGVHFKRWREAFLRPGMQESRWGYPGAGAHGNNSVACGILVTPSDAPGTPDELSIYSVENYGRGQPSRLRRYALRIDGFVSVQAPLVGGQLVTKPMVFDGKQLVVNFSTSAAGSVQVEIQHAEGKPIKGFSLSDCPQIYGDAIEQVVRWKGGSDVGKLAGKPIRLRFVMRDADLYSLRFR